MRAEDFKEMLRAQPFLPLRIHMTDGRTYDIRHPEVVLVLRSRLDIGIATDPSTGIFDRVDHCSLLHVVRVEELQSASPPTNGSS